MALTGKGKLGVTILVAALIGGGAFYANKHKAIKVTTPPAIVEQVAPKEAVAPPPESPIVAEQAPAPKKHKVNKKVGAIPHIKHDRDTLVHHNVQKESGKISEDAALKALAGKDNL